MIITMLMERASILCFLILVLVLLWAVGAKYNNAGVQYALCMVDLLNCGGRILWEHMTRITQALKHLLRAAVPAAFVAITVTSCSLAQTAELKYLPSVNQDYSLSAPVEDETPELVPTIWEADLNHNDVMEMLEVYQHIGYYELVVIEGENIIYTQTVDTEPVQMWEALLLYQDGAGQDWLIRYRPVMDNGFANYFYQVFCLTDEEWGEPSYSWLNFDINFGGNKNFDPEEIAIYMAQINALLEKSTLLINTDLRLAAIFEREGYLVDSLWWLDATPEYYTRDKSKSLLENLLAYQTAMEMYVANRSTVNNPTEAGMKDDAAAMETYSAVLEGNATFFDTGTGKNLDLAHIREVFNSEQIYVPLYFASMDMDGDGICEVILMLDFHASGGYEILHYQDETVYGYHVWPREFLNLKTDGTYESSNSTFNRALLKIQEFSESGFLEVQLAEEDYYPYDSEPGETHGYFAINNQSATQSQTQAMFNHQSTKESVTWYDFTTENIGTVLRK